MLKERIISLLEDLENAPISLNYAAEIINGCLDIMSLTKDNAEYKKFRSFDLRLSMDKFTYLIKEGDENIEQQYWDNSILDLKFDLKSLLRQLK
jgi:hypothetical protein